MKQLKNSLNNPKGEGYFLETAYMHPVCPLSFSHARIFVLADVWARWKRKQGVSVRFPICMHYSGSTAFKISKAALSTNKNHSPSKEDKRILDLLFDFYKIPQPNIEMMMTPRGVLDYFSHLILKTLKNIDISCDYNFYFNTEESLYHKFVRSVFDFYHKKEIVVTSHNKRALNYSSLYWRRRSFSRLWKTKFVPEGTERMIASSIESLDATWSFERDNSIGTELKSSTIGPMFDSELLSVFAAIYPELKKIENSNYEIEAIFDKLLAKIKDPSKETDPQVNRLHSTLLSTLPVNVFLAERHLQSWIAKKICSEAILLPPKLSTKKYFFLGSITVKRKTNSASRGHGPILSPHSIKKYGGERIRLALLLTLSTPHKDYEWGSTLKHAQTEQEKLAKFICQLKRGTVNKDHEGASIFLKKERKKIERLIETGNLRGALLFLSEELPKSMQSMIENEPVHKEKKREAILNFFMHYIKILCPSLLKKIHAK